MENLKEGVRFRPTDAEALTFLLRFIVGQEMNDSGFITTNVDVYNQEPWETYNLGVSCSDDDDDCTQYRFFITKLKKKNKSKYNRTVGNKGSWKQQDRKSVRKNGGVIGYKRNITYGNKNCNLEIYGHWLMKEYQLSDVTIDAICKKFNDEERRHWVLCAIKKKPPTTCFAPNSCGLNLESVENVIERMLKRRSEAAEEQSMYQLEEFLMFNTDESGMRPEIEQQIASWSTNALTVRNNQQQAEEDSCAILVQVPEITTQEEQEEAHAPIFNWTYDASIIQQEEEDTALIFNPNDWRVGELLFSVQ